MNYFRSREALLVATAERVVSLHLEDMASIDREIVPILMTLYGGAVLALVTGPENVPPDSVVQIAHAVVHGVRSPHSGDFPPSDTDRQLPATPVAEGAALPRSPRARGLALSFLRTFRRGMFIGTDEDRGAVAS